MDSSEAIYNGLKDAGIDFIVSVPCVNLSKLLNMIDEDEEITHIPVTREEEGIGICAGAFLGGKRTAILMQNSGLGNSINALKSLTELYEFPLLMIMSHRGTEGENICGQVPMGESTPLILEAMNFKFFKPATPDAAYVDVRNSWDLSVEEGKPVSILLEIKYW
ncbi:MAG: sulfopyruvate decarboxylase subunit alpha [Methanobrevibacter sp.]|jgi:sulfopyruvate decarboxylase subunit alpha|uniref:sulfopyruvate decarboxylase subunit alpha n=1 Tax=Methanobrevibacter sp. TaxID=66852 RepID=UPI0025DF2A05|nr:sulfopyruvate decarboxylase subunit alpha [Methanobrevibacter sp.]MBE6497419.1 sulfopyruvate decarboxylase subunit alpha [Methanobrevibacter sp.]